MVGRLGTPEHAHLVVLQGPGRGFLLSGRRELQSCGRPFSADVRVRTLGRTAHAAYVASRVGAY